MKCKKCNNYISDYSNGCFFCKTKKIKRTCILLLIILLISLSPFGIPEFIRSIQGEEFIGIWLKYSLAFSILVFVTIVIFSKCFLNKHFNKLINIPYTINDLLFINNINGFKYVAYCILKLKIDGIIKYDVITSENEEAQTSSIKLNDKFTSHNLENYRKNNSFLEPIIDFFIEQKNSNSISINDVFENFNPLTKSFKKFQFPNHTIENCAEYAYNVQKYKTIIDSLNLILFWTIFGFGISKLIMGISFEKPISNLILALFCVFFGILLIIMMFQGYSENRLYAKWIKKINEKNFFQYSREQFNELLTKDNFDENEKDKILKTFIIADSKYLATPSPDSSFAATLLFAMISFESRNSSDSSGCSSCSSCGGCGGGCGGCGD